MSGGFRCSAASALRDEDLAGTASTVRTFLLVEMPGPWGVDVLRSHRLSPGLGRHLRSAERAAGVRVLAARRHGRHRHQPSGVRVHVAHADPSRPWLQSGTVTDLEELSDVAWAEVAAGSWAVLHEHPGPLFCVCTHGRHDACCAERGRPLATALHAAYPEQTFEVSHIGGDRFAGNVLVLPDGLYYGRVAAPEALGLAAGHLSGRLDLAHLRGRSGLPMPVQAAEIRLRRELDLPEADAVRLVSSHRTGRRTDARFTVRRSSAVATYDVTVDTAPAPEPHQLTCRADSLTAPPVHELVAIRRS